MKFYNIFYKIKGYFFYKPFFKNASYKFVIINPILITPKFISLGRNVIIRDHARVEGVTEYVGDSFNPTIIISDNVSIEQNFHLTCAKSIIIGENTAIAANVTITDINHKFNDINLPPEKQKLQVDQVEIGANCKIFNNVVILAGTKLGRHTIVGANSVVFPKQYPDFCVLAGNPARIVSKYNFEQNSWQ